MHLGQLFKSVLTQMLALRFLCFCLGCTIGLLSDRQSSAKRLVRSCRDGRQRALNTVLTDRENLVIHLAVVHFWCLHVE